MELCAIFLEIISRIKSLAYNRKVVMPVNKDKKQPENNRIIYTDLLRIVAIFSVIMIHVSEWRIYQLDVFGTVDWYIHLVYFSISWYAVPVFFMISGMFNLKDKIHISPVNDINKMLKKTVKIIYALIFWYLMSSLSTIIGKYFFKPESFNINPESVH
ncbi:hypothetical protein AGMMS4952_27070 [Spirochaetia bacterium]|nr:hypothetical protein AGMMS4952_27070 [Spirochaetia bacterium]